MCANFYDRNARSYFDQTVDADMSGHRERFARRLPAGASILDAGCGSGRDAKAFVAAGFRVTAFDASIEMVRLATEHAQLHVQHLAFDEVSWDKEFEGVWASASLLHVSRKSLPHALTLLRQSLCEGGLMYVSFKHGSTERTAGGRTFTDLRLDKLEMLLLGSGLSTDEVWISEDVRTGRTDEQWVNAICTRQPR